MGIGIGDPTQARCAEERFLDLYTYPENAITLKASGDVPRKGGVSPFRSKEETHLKTRNQLERRKEKTRNLIPHVYFPTSITSQDPNSYSFYEKFLHSFPPPFFKPGKNTEVSRAAVTLVGAS